MKTGEKAAVALGVLALLGVGYAVYFDHKRRNDPKFRRKLKRQRKRAEKDRKIKSDVGETATANIIASALARCDDEMAPTSVEGKEKYFMDQVALGESLLPKGPSAYEDAAVHFYRAFRMMKKQEKYYELFPPSEMNVRLAKLSEIPQPDGTKIVKRALLSSKGFKEGETIFTEQPTVSALHPSLEGGPFCTHCLRFISHGEPSRFCTSCGDKVRFCSETCYEKAQSSYHTLLCTGTHANPDEKTTALLNMAKEGEQVLPLMAARFLLQTVQEEQRRVAAGESDEEYGVWEHLERLKYLELRPTDQDMKERQLVLSVLENKVPGVADFFTDERYMTLKGRMLYNTYAIGTNSDVDGIKIPTFKEKARIDDQLTRVGSGLYLFSSHLTHSCEPNCAIRFVNGKNGNELSLVALQPITEGEQLNITYVPAGEDNHYSERQKTLAEQWRFQCSCARCEREEKSEPPRDAEPLLEEKTPEEIEKEGASTIDLNTVSSTEKETTQHQSDNDEDEEIVAEPRIRSNSADLNPNAPEFKPTWATQELDASVDTTQTGSSYASVASPKVYQTHTKTTTTKTAPADDEGTKTTTVHEYMTETIEELTEEEAAAAIAAGEAVEILEEGEKESRRKERYWCLCNNIFI
ncbi:MAS20 protein import receptor-domain-containing protein [Syncephalis fuscata]|nr:MAS20 protein import receptor-domain-containing protein [Syncephalis fuscata]